MGGLPTSRDRHRDRVAGVNERARTARRRFVPRPGPLRREGLNVVGGLEHPIAVPLRREEIAAQEAARERVG